MYDSEIIVVTSNETRSFGDDIQIAREWLATRILGADVVERLDDDWVYGLIERNYPGGFAGFIEVHG